MSIPAPDFQCTLWPDEWFGVSLTNCCIAHDLGGSDLGLAHCVSNLSEDPIFKVIAVVMLIGMTFGRPVYRWWASQKKRSV